MELHFFKTSSDFYFFFVHVFTNRHRACLNTPLGIPRPRPQGFQPRPQGFSLKKKWEEPFLQEKPWRRGWTSPSFAILEKRGKLGRVNFRKEFWDYFQNWPIADRRVPSNAARNNCGTHFGSSSLLVSKVANRLFQRDIWPNFSFHLSDIFLLLIDLQQEASRPKIARLRSKVAQGH